MRRLVLRALAVAAPVVLLCGCTTLPDSGAVHTRPASAQETNEQVPYFTPRGPADGDSPDAIVHGFLLAMQANPPSTAVARSFLSSAAKNTWTPSRGTVVYDSAPVETRGSEAVVRLRGAYRLTSYGAWVDGTSPSTQNVSLSLVQEEGQWRITNPPDVLAVPSTYFSSLFAPFDLYFFDHSGTVLVPTRVFVPRGEATGDQPRPRAAGGAATGPAQGGDDGLPGGSRSRRRRCLGQRRRNRRGAARGGPAQAVADRAQPGSRPARVDPAPGPRHHPSQAHGRRRSRDAGRRPDRPQCEHWSGVRTGGLDPPGPPRDQRRSGGAGRRRHREPDAGPVRPDGLRPEVTRLEHAEPRDRSGECERPESVRGTGQRRSIGRSRPHGARQRGQRPQARFRPVRRALARRRHQCRRGRAPGPQRQGARGHASPGSRGSR